MDYLTQIQELEREQKDLEDKITKLWEEFAANIDGQIIPYKTYSRMLEPLGGRIGIRFGGKSFDIAEPLHITPWCSVRFKKINDTLLHVFSVNCC